MKISLILVTIMMMLVCLCLYRCSSSRTRSSSEQDIGDFVKVFPTSTSMTFSIVCTSDNFCLLAVLLYHCCFQETVGPRP